METNYTWSVDPVAVGVFAGVLTSAPNYTPDGAARMFGWRMIGSAAVAMGQRTYLFDAPGGLALGQAHRAGADTYWAFMLSSRADAATIERISKLAASDDPFSA